MQLKSRISIRKALATATSGLLGGLPAQEVVAAPENTTARISYLQYAETDRVTVNKTQFIYEREVTDDDVVNFSFVYDTMTGASPNGRKYTDQFDNDVVPITTASGFEFNVSGEGSDLNNRPWLTNFSDTRLAGALDWSRKWFSVLTSSLGGAYSHENDYQSVGGSAKLALETNKKATTFTVGASINNDTISPQNGIPEGLGQLWCEDSQSYTPNWLDCDSPPKQFGDGNKVSTDGLIGVSQVWNRRTVFQINYAIGKTEGYLTDPYKLVSIIDEEFGESAFIYEKRPDNKQHQRIFGKLVYVPGKHALHLSYRYYWDDWGIKAHTVDARFRYEFNPSVYLQPHARYSTQTASDFFSDSIASDALTPEYASADHRLGEQETVTAGLKLGLQLSTIHQISLRGEYMYQRYQSSSLPDMSVTIVQLIYSTKF